MMVFQFAGLGDINFGGAIDSIMIWTLILVGMIGGGLIIYWLYTITTYRIQVELIRQVGQPYYIEDEETGEKTLKINYESDFKSARIYQKKLKSGGFKEYFQIKGTNWNYLNFFQDSDFYFKKAKNVLDFTKQGIKLFVDQTRGIVPLRLANPGFEYSEVTLNEVIGAVTDSLHEREMLYGDDFWSKYGSLITIASLMAFFVIGMIFLIKYQDTFWQNSMKALTSTIKAIKEVSAPNLP